MIKSILLAYDGSGPADKAYDQAAELAGKYGARLTVLAVARPPEFGEEVETQAVIEQSIRHCHHILKPIKDKIHAAGHDVGFEVAVGHPAEQIILHAEKLGADLIVMGHKGTGLLARWLVGSTVKHVIAHAPCAVMVAR